MFPKPLKSQMKSHWLLEPETTFLNHGSFGAVPKEVLAYQQALQEQLERQPVRFYLRDVPQMMTEVRARVAKFVGVATDSLFFVDNATVGVNTALRSAGLGPGDEIVVTNHEYKACRNAASVVARETGAHVVEVDLPFPISGKDVVLERLEQALGPKTKLVLIDHITSQTGLVLPVQEIVDLLNAKGIASLIDGAHAPGMVPLSLEKLGATYYTGNCHKWLCSTKSCAILVVREDALETLRPLVVSHGETSQEPDLVKRLHFQFDWVGTKDVTATLSVPKALDVMGEMIDGGWPALMAHNHHLALAGSAEVIRELGLEPPAPASMIGSIASMMLPDHPLTQPTNHPLYLSALQDELMTQFQIEVPIIPWHSGRSLLRVSAQLHNHLDEYRYLAEALGHLLG